MKAKDIERVIEADGWYRMKSKGHRQYKHPSKSGRVTIPWHKDGSIDLNPKTLESIYSQAKINKPEK